MKSNTQWMGSCTSEADGAAFPFIMLVLDRQQSTFTGTIQWPTLNSAKTKFRGEIKGEDVTWEEHEVITGEDDVEIPMKYVGKLSGGTCITGKNVTDDPDMASTFKLEKITTPASKDYDVIKPKTKWKGTVYQPFQFEFEITKRKGVEIEGEVTWPGLDNAKTKVRGTIEGEIIEFEEFESKSDAVVIPVSYIGKFVQKNIAGKFKGQDTTGGTFELDLSQNI